MAAVDYFLKIDGIQGESSDAKHKGEIELESFSWGETQSGGHGGGGGAGKAQMQDFNFVARVNKASPTLMLACASGQHIKEAVMTARKAGKGQQEFLVYKFTDLLVSSYQVGGSAHGDVVPMDQISFTFAKIEVEYRLQQASGAAGGSVKAGWDVKQNKPV
jgi:type VI secretion system secreted protein Hcp